MDTLPLPRSASLETLVALVASGVFLLGIVASAAAAFGAFRVVAPALLLLAAATAALIVWVGLRRGIPLALDRYDVVALLGSLTLALTSVLLHHRTFLAQTDVGFYANDAVIIAETGGRLLTGTFDRTLPGFEATPSGNRLGAMFGYPAFAALVVWLAGPASIQWANLPFLLITLLGLYLLGRRLGAKVGALLGILFYGTSLVTVWLSRYMMTENAMTAAFWFAVLQATMLLRRSDAVRAALLVPPLAYMALVRPEGIAVAAWFVLVLLIARRRDTLAFLRRPSLRRLLRPARRAAVVGLVVLSTITLGAVATTDAVPTTYLRQALQVVTPALSFRPVPDALDVPTSAPVPTITEQAPLPAAGGDTWDDYALRYEWDSVVAHHLPWFLLIALVGMLLRLLPWRGALHIGLFVLPFAIFVLMPPVTTQQPWFMRRLWMAWIPFTFLLAGAALDFHKAAWRWPIRRRRTTRPRPDGAIACGVVAMILLVPHLDLTVPVFTRHEQDGWPSVVPKLLDMVPRDAVLIFDEDVAGFSTLYRTQSGAPVVAWFYTPVLAFHDSIVASDSYPRTFILRLNTTRPVAVMETATGGSHPVGDLAFERREIPASDLRDYVAHPPLEEGYAPFGRYLDAILPPRLFTLRFRASLLEADGPLILQKNIRFNSTEWTRTADGMRAVVDDASLHINTTLFRQEVLLERSLALHTMHEQSDTVDRTFRVVTPFGVADLPLPITSDGSATLRLTSNPLPPLPREILCPNGTVLRGIYFGLS